MRAGAVGWGVAVVEEGVVDWWRLGKLGERMVLGQILRACCERDVKRDAIVFDKGLGTAIGMVVGARSGMDGRMFAKGRQGLDRCRGDLGIGRLHAYSSSA